MIRRQLTLIILFGSLLASHTLAAAPPGSRDKGPGEAVREAYRLLTSGDPLGAHRIIQPVADAHPDDPDAQNLAGFCAEKAGDISLAIRRHRRAVSLITNPKALSGAHGALGGHLMAVGSYKESIHHSTRAMELDPSSAPHAYNRGLARYHLRDLTGAAGDYRRALELDPDHEAAANNLGVCLMTLERFADAIEAYEAANAIHRRLAQRGGVKGRLAELPDPRTYFNHLLCLHRVAGDWERYVDNQRLLLEIPGPRQATPFNCLELAVLSPVECLDVAVSWVRDHVAESRGSLRPAGAVSAFDLSRTRPPRRGSRDPSRPRKKRRLRVAYVHSNAFREATTTARLLVGMFALHDRKRLHVHCLSMGASDGSVTRARIERGCETFKNIPDDHGPAAKAVYDTGAHIAIDIAGLTIMPIARLLYMRPAPVQVAFHGFPGSSASPDVDYLVTDAIVSPPQYARSLYVEKLVYMPHTYFATSYAITHREVLLPSNPSRGNDANSGAVQRPTRAEIGIPSRFDASFLLCSFNQFYKVTPDLFAVWMRILHRVPGAALWMVSFSDDAEANFRRYARGHAKRLGLSDPESLASRVFVTPKIPRAREYLAKGHCGLFLDSPLFNGHSTATDALWSGVPVVTVVGGAGLPSRVAASLLRSVGLPDLIASDMREYEEIAISIAGDPERALGIRRRLETNRVRFPLFDTARFTRNFDAALQMMWEVHAAGMKPMHIAVTDDDPMENPVPF